VASADGGAQVGSVPAGIRLPDGSRADATSGPSCSVWGVPTGLGGYGPPWIQTHEPAAWLYAFLIAVRSGDLYAPPHVVEVVKRVLARYEMREQSRGDVT
jgi:hypothetical protein